MIRVQHLPESGSKVPADLRLIYSRDLFMNESLLTGESVDVQKDADFISDDYELPVADRINMAYAGSFVSKGRAKGIVVSIALDTQIGKIAELLAGLHASLTVAKLIASLTIARLIAVAKLIVAREEEWVVHI